MAGEILPFKQVDVFTQVPFKGNPVAVVIGATELTNEEMQRIAAWTNLSETTFVLPPSCAEADYRLRIFTPRNELRFAGHPTIGSAHAVIESRFSSPREGKLRQECLAGILPLTVQENADGTKIMVQAPAARISKVDEMAVKILARGLGASPVADPPALRVDMGVVWLVASMGDAATVASLQPDFNLLTTMSNEMQITGVTVFGAAEDDVASIHTRSFAPAQGVPEDPVCGSGNASVAAFLIHSGLIERSSVEYCARQGMQVGRDGRVAVRVDGDVIQIGGYAVTCVDGKLRVKP